MAIIIFVFLLVAIPIRSFAETPKQEATRLCSEYVRIKKACYHKATKGVLPVNGLKGIKSKAPKELIEESCKEGFDAFAIDGNLKQVELNQVMLVSFTKCNDDYISFIPRRSCSHTTTAIRNATTEMEAYYADNKVYPNSIPNLNKISLQGVKLSMTGGGQSYRITGMHSNCDTIYETSSEAPEVKPVSAVAEQQNAIHKGRVLFTTTNGDYSYVKFEENGEILWVACDKTKIESGDVIEFPHSEPLINFKSKPLNMTFDKIFFIPRLKVTQQ